MSGITYASAWPEPDDKVTARPYTSRPDEDLLAVDLGCDCRINTYRDRWPALVTKLIRALTDAGVEGLPDLPDEGEEG
ncbi:MAG TPA: hypothetical protein VGW74_09430 [Propionibacteriaceae bacterium]|nr:hypothetical protein [Propionibacteriaceae bacterium]